MKFKSEFRIPDKQYVRGLLCVAPACAWLYPSRAVLVAYSVSAQALVDQAQGDRGGKGLGGTGPLRQEQKVAHRLCSTATALAILRVENTL